MSTPRPPGFDTLSLHAGHHPDAAHGARAVPIYQTTSYVFDDTDQAASLFNLERPGYLQLDFQPDGRRSRGTPRRPGRRSGLRLHGQRDGGDAHGHRDVAGCG